MPVRFSIECLGRPSLQQNLTNHGLHAKNPKTRFGNVAFPLVLGEPCRSPIEIKMFDDPNNPQHLMESLFALVETLHGHQSWYGIATDKLAATSLPKPLELLYAKLGNMPNDRECPFPFSTQDHLVPFELLRNEDSRLWFAAENQGCWQAYTETSGDDPPVWFTAEESDPVLEHPSLANFLVTLCLQELTMGCPYLFAGDDLPTQLGAHGHRLTPLWTKGLFPGFGRLLNPQFYLVDGHVLLFDKGWIGFRHAEEAEPYANALQDAKRIHPPETLSMAEYLAKPDRNPTAVRLYYERLARDYQAQADLFSAKAEACLQASRDGEPSGPERV